MGSALRVLRSWWRWFFALIGPAIFLAIILRIDLAQLIAEVYVVDAWKVLVSGILAIVVILIKGIRWYELVIVYGLSIKMLLAIRINYEGAFWGGVTPGKLGEFIKAKRTKDATGSDLFGGVMVCSIDKIFDLLAVGLVTIVSGFVVAPTGLEKISVEKLGGIQNYSGILFAVVIVGVGMLLVFACRARARLSQIFETLARYCSVRGIYILLISIASLFVYVYAVYVIAYPVLPEVSFSQVTFFVAITMLAGALPVSIGNIGTRDVVAIGILGMWGVDSEAAVAVSLMMMFLYIVATLGSWIIYKVYSIR